MDGGEVSMSAFSNALLPQATGFVVLCTHMTLIHLAQPAVLSKGANLLAMSS